MTKYFARFVKSNGSALWKVIDLGYPGFHQSRCPLFTCVLIISIIKQYWKKISEIPPKKDFFTCSIHIFVRKMKQFARKYYVI